MSVCVYVWERGVLGLLDMAPKIIIMKLVCEMCNF